MPRVYAQGVEVRFSPASQRLLQAAGAEADCDGTPERGRGEPAARV